MAHRLSRIVTRTGDEGYTSLGSGARVEKTSPTIEALGAIDELNSWIGLLVAFAGSDEVKAVFTLVQHDLFDLGAQLSVPGTPLLSSEHLRRIEEAIDRMNADLTPLREFILPGGAQSSALAHVARTVCRRAERQLLRLIELSSGGFDNLNAHDKGSGAKSFGISYLNRLSDLIFIAARIENRTGGRPDMLWERGKSLVQERAHERTSRHPERRGRI